MTTFGSINEKGFIANIDKKGFSFPKCISELYSNSIDAKCNKIITLIEKDTILFIDNGDGMTKDNLKNMFDMYRNNHPNEATMGISGFGGKAATKILSKNSQVMIYTKNNNFNHIKVTIPWDEIIKEGKYSNKIIYDKMNDKEKINFNRYVNNQTGTIITFKNNNELETILKEQYNNPSSIHNTSERFDIIFQQFSNIDFIFKINDNIEYKLKLYRPSEEKVYDDILFHTIKIYKNNNEKYYIFTLEKNNKEYWFKRINNVRTANEIDEFTEHSHFTEISTINIKTYMLYDTTVFDEKNPKYPTSSTAFINYDINFFSKDANAKDREFIANPSLFRNNQFISKIKTENHKLNSARADWKCCIKYWHTRAEISYETKSYIGNEIDNIIGIQENKNQLDTTNIPKQLLRLIEYCKEEKSKQIITYIEKSIIETMPPPPPSPPPYPSPLPHPYPSSLPQPYPPDSSSDEEEDTINKGILIRKIACLLKKYKEATEDSFDIQNVKNEIIYLANNI